MKKLCRFIIITLTIMSVMYLLAWSVSPYTYEYEKATASMESRKHESTPKPDNYYVYLRSQDITGRIDSMLLYKQFEQDKKIDVYIEKAYDKRNQLVSQRIVLYKPKDK